MIGTTVTPTIVVTPPTVEVEIPAIDLRPEVDLHHVAYFRDNTSYDDLLRALRQRVSVLQKRLAVLCDR